MQNKCVFNIWRKVCMCASYLKINIYVKQERERNLHGKKEVYFCSCRSSYLARILCKVLWSVFSLTVWDMHDRVLCTVSATGLCGFFLPWLFSIHLFCFYNGVYPFALICCERDYFRMKWLYVTAIWGTWNNTCERFCILAACEGWCIIKGWMLQCLQRVLQT